MSSQQKLTRKDRDIPADEEFTLAKTADGLSFNFTWIRGNRQSMEDSHLAEKLENIWLFAIFDGHGGKSVSQLLPKILPKVLKNKIIEATNICFSTSFTIKEKLAYASKMLTPEQSKQAIINAFEETDIELFRELKQTTGKKVDGVGATAAVVLVHKNFITTAHCGDSRIHLYSSRNSDSLYTSTDLESQKIHHCTTDHKPDGRKEKLRIEKNGGIVIVNRINGDLAVARAFGDYQYKEIGGSSRQNLVISKPDIYTVNTLVKQSQIKGIMICCDGVTDVMTDRDILQIYRISRGQSCELIRKAYRKKSQDNISAGFILL